MIKTLDFVAVNGPTWGAPNVPPFQWSKSDYQKIVNHYGQPDLWTFDPIRTKWQI